MQQKKTKPKIIFFLPNLEIGGAERVTINLLNGLDAEKFNLFLILGKKEGYYLNEISRKIPIIDLRTLCSLKLFFGLIKQFRKEKPDIFISIFPRFTIISMFAKIFSRSKTKFVIIEHSPFSMTTKNISSFIHKQIARFGFSYLMKFFYPKAQALLCVSKGVAVDFKEIVNIQNKIKVIYSPIISKEIYALAKKPVKHPWFLDQKTPIIIAVGRLCKAKDYPTLIKAFSLVESMQPARLIILGKDNKEQRKKMEQLINSLEISNNVSFLGVQENPYKFMSKSLIFVLSSIQEGFPTVIVEAMACGVPVVSTDCNSGPNEIIKNNENGFLVPVGNEKLLADAILKLIENPFLRNKFSEEGKKRALDFEVEKSIRKYEQFFLNLLKN